MKNKKINLLDVNDSDFDQIQKLWESKNTAGTFSPIELIQFSKLILRSIKNIKESNNSRVIVLETWLILDYSIREILRKGLDIKRFCDENFDPLPNSFRECSLMLKNFINQQKSKTRNPYFIHSEIHVPSGLLNYFLKNNERLKELTELEKEFYEKYNLKFNEIYYRNNNEFQNVDIHWLNSIQKLDEAWFSHAEKINKIRNKAAHSIDEESIYMDVGINGKDKLKKLKNYCIESLSSLIGPNLKIE